MSTNIIERCIKAILPSRQFSSKPVLSSRSSKRTSLSFNRLEDRNLLATITVDAGIMTINGTNDRDVVVLIQNDNGTFDVDDDGAISTYNNADIENIVFRGRLGNDEFINNTFETSSFFGHGGDDVFFGGVMADFANGGDGNDEIYGGFGDDTLYGGEGDDEVHGDEGEDRIFGGNGHDRIYGGADDDFLSAEAGDDIMFGGTGDDFLRGFLGNDTIHGDEGKDLVFGQAGDDTIYGNDGDDRLRGNNDNDTIYGQLGDDVLIGDAGDDVFYGGDGNETIYGFTGDDILYGDNGDDKLFDGDGNDQLYGGNGHDILRGGNGNDVLRGGDGSDTLRGDGGNDALYGGALLDRLFGGDGDDSLHGGEGVHVDIVNGEAGSDRYHEDDNDNIIGRTAEDVTIKYETTFVSWNDMEIEVLDRGFQQIYDAAGSNALLRETHTNGDTVTIYKYQDLPGTTTSDNIINQTTNLREIHIVDFDETTDIGQTFFQSEIVRQFGRNWDSPEELGTLIADSQTQWQTFLNISQWTQVDPQSPNFLVSGDGEWWYHETANFTGIDGQQNPEADFVSVWSATMSGAFTNGLQSKVDWLINAIV